MWRRSLGGRAHPLAPALSAALQRLTGLTNLAVDGKFSQLGVVSGLTRLRQLASAAPMSKEGWQVGFKSRIVMYSTVSTQNSSVVGREHVGWRVLHP
jgi:hypothetical protein